MERDVGVVSVVGAVGVVGLVIARCLVCVDLFLPAVVFPRNGGIGGIGRIGGGGAVGA